MNVEIECSYAIYLANDFRSSIAANRMLEKDEKWIWFLRQIVVSHLDMAIATLGVCCECVAVAPTSTKGKTAK